MNRKWSTSGRAAGCPIAELGEVAERCLATDGSNHAE
jgi:hypothetical protein